MYILFSILILITSILLGLIVLVQNSKGGGLASNFSGSNQVMGVRRTTDFLEKATWTLAIVLLVLSLVSVFAINRRVAVENTNSTELQKQIDEAEETQPVNFQVPPAE